MTTEKTIKCPRCFKWFDYSYYMTNHVDTPCSFEPLKPVEIISIPQEGKTMSNETDSSSVLHVPQSDKKPTMPRMTTFDTGATRSQDKAHVRYDLISPNALRRIATVCHNGAAKYSPFNYEKGMPISDILNHAIAHIYKYLSGEESDEDDLAHAFWNLHAAIDMEHRHPTMDHGLRPGHKLSERWRTPKR